MFDLIGLCPTQRSSIESTTFHISQVCWIPHRSFPFIFFSWSHPQFAEVECILTLLWVAHKTFIISDAMKCMMPAFNHFLAVNIKDRISCADNKLLYTYVSLAVQEDVWGEVLPMWTLANTASLMSLPNYITFKQLKQLDSAYMCKLCCLVVINIFID